MNNTFKNVTASFGASRLYWFEKKPNDIMFSIELLKQYSKSENKILFLQEQLLLYSNAPDLSIILAMEYEKIKEYKKAIELYHKVLEIYPNLIDVKLLLDMSKKLLLSDSMPNNIETLQWLKNEIDKTSEYYSKLT